MTPTPAPTADARTNLRWADLTVATRVSAVVSIVVVAALGVASAVWELPARLLTVWLVVWAALLAVRYARLARRRWGGLWVLLGFDVVVLAVLAATTSLTRVSGLAVTAVIALVVANAGGHLANR